VADVSQVPYDRAVLVETLVYHYAERKSISQACGCGWGSRPEHLGLSHPEHVADVYEASMLARGQPG
jgi:hypothetical protein